METWKMSVWTWIGAEGIWIGIWHKARLTWTAIARANARVCMGIAKVILYCSLCKKRTENTESVLVSSVSLLICDDLTCSDFLSGRLGLRRHHSNDSYCHIISSGDGAACTSILFTLRACVLLYADAGQAKPRWDLHPSTKYE